MSEQVKIYIQRYIDAKDTPVTVYLLSGVGLDGKLISYDVDSLILQRDNGPRQLIMLHAVATIQPKED